MYSFFKLLLFLLLLLLHFHCQQAGFFRRKLRGKLKAPEKPAQKSSRGGLSRANAVRRKGVSTLFYHGYDLGEIPVSAKWNGSPMGKKTPILHGAFAIKGSQWEGGGRQFEVEMYGNHGMYLSKNPIRENWNEPKKRLRVQRYLGQTSKSPAEIDAFRNDLMQPGAQFAKDKYNMLNNNCNHFCKEMLEYANAGKKLPKNFNRLAGIFGTRNLRKLGQVMRYYLGPQQPDDFEKYSKFYN